MTMFLHLQERRTATLSVRKEEEGKKRGGKGGKKALCYAPRSHLEALTLEYWEEDKEKRREKREGKRNYHLTCRTHFVFICFGDAEK